MKSETAHKLFNRLNNHLTETIDTLSMLHDMINEVDNQQDYNITQYEINMLKNKKKDLLIEMTKLQKSF